MSARPPGRVMGTETEFGIVAVDAPQLSSVVTSTQVVRAYTDPGVGGDAPGEAATGWSYGSERPLRDARGFDLGAARPVRTIDPSEFGITNRVLTNGARFYVDHAHPEYSGPEVTSPLDAVVWDRAGDLVMHRAGLESSATEGNAGLKLYKNNVDGKGASYGAHENYLVRRDVDFDRLVTGLIPHFVSRQVYCGAGRVGIGQDGREPGFQLSQRADYIEVEVGLETTLRRGIVNTRDEPHARDEQWRRLHVIIGDANLAETAIYLKLGTTALVLSAIEAGTGFADLVPVDPVDAVHAISHDPTLAATVALTGGEAVTGIEMQRRILQRCRPLVGGDDDPGWFGEVLAEWEQVLDDLERDPASCADRLDWPAKLGLLEAYRRRDGLDWSHARLALVDLQYHDLDPARGLHLKLLAAGRMRRLTTDAQLEAAVVTPPESTRAWLRGRYLAEHPDRVIAAGWDQLTVAGPDGRPELLDLSDPYHGTRADCLAEPALLDPDSTALHRSVPPHWDPGSH